ncbi:MAG: right-handed parallel beta-helix repeat-containing protein [Frankiales bacterium]|nr:right-handed parallel beta-helix repeat-containing protein [Frankiales bacterium]
MTLTRRIACTVLAVSLGAAGLGLLAPSASAAEARTYYVSASGNDQLDGLTEATAWRTLQAASNHVFTAGDTVLLQGGSTFTGPLYLDAQDAGVTVGSFGSGRARIDGNGTPGVLGYDAGGLTVRDLDLVGDAAAYASKGGLSLYSDLPAGQRLTGITISGVSVQGFKNGVEIGGANPGAGFAQVSIADVKAVGNRDAGVITYGPSFDAGSPSYAHLGVNVARTVASNNLGNPADKVHNSGSGIVLGSVDGGSILSSTASGNGSRCVAPECGVGIWTYDARGIRIAYSSATNNRTGSSADGDGFDLDQNVSGSYLEHNTSSGNDGAGYLVYTGQTNAAHHHNVVRWNTSTGDARKNSWYGGITLAGKVQFVTVTGNKVDTSSSASHAPALSIKPGVAGAKISGNTLKSASGSGVVVSPKISRSAAAISSNTWAATVQRVRWGTDYASVAAWTKATGQS